MLQDQSIFDGESISHIIAKKALDSSSDMQLSAEVIASTIIKVFSPWAIAIFILVWIYGLWKKWVNEKEITPNIPELTRLLVLISLFFSYNFIAPPFQYVINTVTYGSTEIFDSAPIKDFTFIKNKQYINSLSIDNEEKIRLIKIAKDEGTLALRSALSEVNIEPSILDSLNIYNLINGLIGLATVILSGVVKFICYMLIYGCDILLYCLGPLALLFSMIPVFKDKIYSWLGTWLVVKFSYLTLMILQTIAMNITVAFMQNAIMGYTPDSIYLTFGLGLMNAVLCILSFWFTSKFIGSGDAGKVLSTTAAVAKMFVTAGVSAALGSSSSGGGTLQALGNIGKGSVKDNKPNE
jgi:hypothetical protein